VFFTTASTTLSGTTTVSASSFYNNPFTPSIYVHDIETSIEECRAILESFHSKEEFEKMVVAYRITKKDLE